MTAQSVMMDPFDSLMGSEARGATRAVARRGAGAPGGTVSGGRSDADIAALLSDMPVGLAVAMRLHRAGHADAVIATALDIPVESVAVTLRVARGKLDRLRHHAAA